MKLSLLIPSLVLSVSGLGATTLTDVGYPPPGGVTYSTNGGSSISGSGVTRTYSNFNINPAQYSAFYWGPTSVVNVYNSTDANQSPSQMTYAGYIGGGTYEFTDSATWDLNSTQYGNQNLNTRMLLTVSGLGAEATEGSLGASTTPADPLFLVSGTFTATIVYQAEEGTTWEAVGDLYNSLNTNPGNQVETSSNYDFFTAPAATPEPGTMALLGGGGMLVVLIRRRKSAGLGV